MKRRRSGCSRRLDRKRLISKVAAEPMIFRARTADLRLSSISCVWRYGWIANKEDSVIKASGAFIAVVDT